MKMKLKLKLHDIYGGDGYIRYEDKKVPKLSRKKTTTRKKEDVGISVDQSIEEEMYEIKKTEIHTFKRDGDKYFLRLGGVHGKFWGLLKEAGRFLKEIGNNDFPSLAFVDRMMKQVNVFPIYCELRNITNMKEDTLSQTLAGIGKTMIFPIFDVIEECETDIVLEYPNTIKIRIERMLEQSQNMSAFNKRRGTMEILESSIS